MGDGMSDRGKDDSVLPLVIVTEGTDTPTVKIGAASAFEAMSKTPAVKRPTICRDVVFVDIGGEEHPAKVTEGSREGDPELRCNLRVLWNGDPPEASVDDPDPSFVPNVPHALFNPERNDRQPGRTWHWPVYVS